MDDLIARLEAAEEGSYSLSCEIGDALNLPKRYQHPGSENPSHESYTTSLDDALTLVPEGWEWEIGSARLITAYWAELISIRTKVQQKAATPALALCIAALKARKEDV